MSPQDLLDLVTDHQGAVTGLFAAAGGFVMWWRERPVVKKRRARRKARRAERRSRRAERRGG